MPAAVQERELLMSHYPHDTMIVRYNHNHVYLLDGSDVSAGACYACEYAIGESVRTGIACNDCDWIVPNTLDPDYTCQGNLPDELLEDL